MLENPAPRLEPVSARSLDIRPRSTDRELLEALAQGQLGVLADLYERHGPFVYGLARGLCGSEVAEVVTAKVFVALRNNPPEFNAHGGSLRAALLAETQRRALSLIETP